MIDEKKIEKAAIKSSIAYSDGRYEDLGFQDGFKAGINWFLDNLWHDASEEPKGGLLLVEYDGDMASLFSLAHKKDYKYLGSNVKRWLYVDDLLKGGK